MAIKMISVPVFYDGSDNFLNGQIVDVSPESIVVGTTLKPSGPSVPGFAITTVDTLQIKDPIKGTLFLSITSAQWFNLASGYNPYDSPYQTVKAITLDYTILPADNQLLLLASGGPGSIIVPANSDVPIPIGFIVDIVQMDSDVIFTPSGDVIINSVGGNLTISAQYVGVTLEKIGTDIWLLFGSLIP